jgi:DNA-binding GntR family transcriptional regulator
MTIFSTIRPITLREQIADQVRTAIIEGYLKPKDHITEAGLTHQLGVSRTPVREALILLEREGLVDFYPNRGYFVRSFTAKDVEEIFSMRTALENLAAEINLAQDRLDEAAFAHLYSLIKEQHEAITQGDIKRVRRTDMRFHQFLVDATEHDLLMRDWRGIVAQIAALLYMRADAFPDYDEYQVIKDHQDILSAYRTGDALVVARLNGQINRRVAMLCVEALLVNR